MCKVANKLLLTALDIKVDYNVVVVIKILFTFL